MLRLWIILLFVSKCRGVLFLNGDPLTKPDYNAPDIILSNATGNITDQTFSRFKNLTGLRIAQSYIDIIDPKAFIHTPFLELLELTDNYKLPFLSKNTFKYLNRLKLLRMDNNRNSYIRPGTFRYLNKLDVLAVQNHKDDFRHVTRDMFEGVSSITQLSLTGNDIQHLDEDAFTDLKNLEYVYLSRNKLRRIVYGTFSSTAKLKELHLDSNQLGNVDWKIFDRLLQVTFINLAINSMTKLEVGDLVLAFPALKYVNFRPNNFTCAAEYVILKDLTHYSIENEYYQYEGLRTSACDSEFTHLSKDIFIKH